MYVNGQIFTLADLSRGKIEQNYVNEKFVERSNYRIPQLDFTQNQSINQPENNLYIDDRYKNIYNGGYIFSTLPYPYDIVYRDGEYYVEVTFPKLYESQLSQEISSQISEPNPYVVNKIKESTKRDKIVANKSVSKPTISKLMR
jgi:hypothetical protein